MNCQAACSLMVEGGLEASLSPQLRLVLLLSAACHDVGHPGLNNAYLVQVRIVDGGDYNVVYCRGATKTE